MTRSGSLAFVLLAGITSTLGSARAQEAALVPDTSLPIPQLHFDSTGALLIKASATSSVHDFDYLIGNWKLRNRRLKSARLGNGIPSTCRNGFDSRREAFSSHAVLVHRAGCPAARAAAQRAE
jgi:hypothetical protein